jgi:hypothetical protein
MFRLHRSSNSLENLYGLLVTLHPVISPRMPERHEVRFSLTPAALAACAGIGIAQSQWYRHDTHDRRRRIRAYPASPGDAGVRRGARVHPHCRVRWRRPHASVAVRLPARRARLVRRHRWAAAGSRVAYLGSLPGSGATIVVVASVRNGAARDLLAANLAVLRAREGRSICLLDTDPRRVRCRSRSRTCSSAMPTS